MDKFKNKCCNNCFHCEPDDIIHETLDITFWCNLHCTSISASDVCSDFLFLDK